ncbi:hypothetical protein GWK47_022075 [Chionoecetes opilio]|uniref:Uncharacterized protein n=1 Tax=Chionoecetes opilio TaxID=41210 RepID=A0A8J5CDZ9_CHIOP|nr:hypothetical protein GWK47_022075 [Chionoecetes opilio]
MAAATDKEFGKTPQASLKKRVATPGASLRKVPVFHLGGTPATSLLRMMPQFHTGLTPMVSSKKQLLTSKKHSKEEEPGVARRHVALPRMRKLDRLEDLGVQPLPLTPPVAVSKKMAMPASCLQGLPRPSFAPADFAFKFEIPKTEDPSAACPGDSLIPLNAEVSPDDECETEPESDTRNVNEAMTDDLPEDLKAHNTSEAEIHLQLSDNEGEMDETPGEPKEITERNQAVSGDDCLSPSGSHTSRLEAPSEEKAKPKKSIRANTPAKYLTRKSVGCCFDGSVTPTVSRLRPRTPCSRTTRRSLSAHCDSPWEMHTPYTPGRRSSARKTPRKSVSKASKLKDLHESHENLQPVLLDGEAGGSFSHDPETGTVNATEESQQPNHPESITDVKLKVVSQIKSFSPLLTPDNVFRREHGMWTVETSPWVTSQRSRKKKSHTVSDIDGMFDDLPTDGSPLPLPTLLIPDAPVPVVTEAGGGEDTVCTHLLTLLQPSTALNIESPVDVWGESPATTILGAPKTSKVPHSPQEGNPEDTAGGSEVTSGTTTRAASGSPASSVNILIPCINGDEKVGPRRGARKSRKSVMFAIAEQDNVNTYKLPGTPIRTSSRVSMGLFAKIDLCVDQPVHDDQDLIVFDTPKSENKTASTRRRSSRMSLLPGMTPSPSLEAGAPVPTELMTWDSPEPRRVSSLPVTLCEEIAPPAQAPGLQFI